MATQISRRAAADKVASLLRVALLGIGLLTPFTAATANPQETVRSFYEVLLTNMRNGRVLGENGCYARLAPVVDRIFDIPFMTRLAIGPIWSTLAATQQQQLVEAFAHYVAATYADQFDSYSGEKLQVIDERPYGAERMVQTRMVKSNGESTRLDYLIRQDRISDVYLDSTVSQLAVRRSEFHSILQQEGIDGLVTALNRKIDLLKSVARAP